MFFFLCANNDRTDSHSLLIFSAKKVITQRGCRLLKLPLGTFVWSHRGGGNTVGTGRHNSPLSQQTHGCSLSLSAANEGAKQKGKTSLVWCPAKECGRPQKKDVFIHKLSCGLRVRGRKLQLDFFKMLTDLLLNMIYFWHEIRTGGQSSSDIKIRHVWLNIQLSLMDS